MTLLDTPKRVAVYVRVSTEEQAEHGFSIDAQLQMLRDYCKSTNRVIVDEYVDRGVSGKSVEGRYELQRLLADSTTGKFMEVACWKINRLARKQLDLLKIVEHLSTHNVSFRSISENFETETPMGKFALQMLGAVGELERNTIVDNVKMGMKQRARSGKWNGGTLLGYETKVLVENSNRRGRQTKLTVVPEEAQVVRKIFELYASGKGLKAITNFLNHQGYRTKRGNPFSVDAISDILKNPTYVGKIRYNVRENWSTKRRKGINKNYILTEGEHEPIIRQELWDQVQVLYAKKGGKPPRVFHGAFPLTGILRCPVCGAGMVAHRVKDELKSGQVVYRRYYVCGAFRNKGSAVCSSNGISALDAENAVFDRLQEVITKPKLLRDVVDSINRNRRMGYKPLETELTNVEKSLQVLESRKNKWYELWEADGIDRDVLLSRLDELKMESERLESRRSELRATLAAGNTAPVPLAVVKAVLTRFHKLMDKSPPEQQKALLHVLVKRIEVKNRKIDAVEIIIDETLQKSFLGEGPSGSPEGPFDYKGVLPLTITL